MEELFKKLKKQKEDWEFIESTHKALDKATLEGNGELISKLINNKKYMKKKNNIVNSIMKELGLE